MKNYINLLTKDNNKHLILFIILNMILVFAETFSIALIPLFIDFVVSSEPILPKYYSFFKNFLNSENKDDLLNFGIIFFFYYYLLNKNFFYTCRLFFIRHH